MPPVAAQQMLIGVDVGGTFTDLVAWDGHSLLVHKIPSTPPKFHEAVIEAVNRVAASPGRSIVHGSTVATNALLQRRGPPIAFITTEGFRDMLLIGRQSRPKLYALRVERPAPIATSENCFTVRERIDAAGDVVEPLQQAEIDRVIRDMSARGLKHAAVCLLFSYINPMHERMLGEHLENAGITASLSSDVMPEFREYERASTTTLNAFLHPIVQESLAELECGLGKADLCIMHSGGGTLAAREAGRSAVRMVLSGPAGGVIGAAYVARLAGFENVVTYDMGGTSTDVSTVIAGRPQWTTSSVIDGLPIGLPMFDIHTIGAGGGSIAYLDAGGALRVGPQSAGALPGPACYGRGGTLPTVTDANVVLGRIIPEHFLGGAMRLDPDASHSSIEPLARQMNKSIADTALGIVRVVEANMALAVRSVTARRGHDPRGFTLVSFGGAGGLHACGLADMLDIREVLVPHLCGVLSALGMILAPPVVDVSQTILRSGGELTDASLAKLLNDLQQRLGNVGPQDQVEYFADVRFLGQSHEVTVSFDERRISHIHEQFRRAYAQLYQRLPEDRLPQIVSLRVRRIGKRPDVSLPKLAPGTTEINISTEVYNDAGQPCQAAARSRSALLNQPPFAGPMLIIDPEATSFVPRNWSAQLLDNGSVVLKRTG